MKEATGELSTTVITVVAIGAILTLFTVFILPSLRSTIKAGIYCESRVNCESCGSDGKQTCHYYTDNDDKVSVSQDTIDCPCDN